MNPRKAFEQALHEAGFQDTDLLKRVHRLNSLSTDLRAELKDRDAIRRWLNLDRELQRLTVDARSGRL